MALQISTMEVFESNGIVNLNTLTILAKVPSGMPDQVQNVLPASGYNTAFKIQAEVSISGSK